jgi:hypothetical protein
MSPEPGHGPAQAPQYSIHSQLMGHFMELQCSFVRHGFSCVRKRDTENLKT